MGSWTYPESPFINLFHFQFWLENKWHFTEAYADSPSEPCIGFVNRINLSTGYLNIFLTLFHI